MARARRMIRIALHAALAFIACACASEGLPRSVDPHWVERCNGGATNVYGFTKEFACTQAGHGFETAGDAPRAAAYYRRACEVGAGESCLEWARVLRLEGNVSGERFVLANAAACDEGRYAEVCGMQLAKSYETEEPTAPEEVTPLLRKLCHSKQAQTACARLDAMHDPGEAPSKKAPQATPTAITSAPAPAPTVTTPSSPSPATTTSTTGFAHPYATQPAAAAPAPPRTCRVLSACVAFEIHKVETPCDGGLSVTVTNKCDRKTRCQWCQAKGDGQIDRSTCGSQEFEPKQTYSGAASFCSRGTRGENVAYVCSDAEDPPTCTTP